MILHYKSYGDSGNPVICIVHGLFGSLDNWHNIARSLSQNFYVVSFDLRNHGNSGHSNEHNYDVMADDIAASLASLSISNCHLIGHSMGGKAVMRFVELHPSMANKFIVVDIAPKKYKPSHEVLFQAMFALKLEDFENRNEIDENLAQSIQDNSVRQFLLKSIERRRSSGFQWKLNLPIIYKNYETISNQIIPDWPINMDCLFIKGELSNYITKEDETDILSHFPNASFATIKDAGHWVHADNPKSFVSVVTAFLS